MELQELIMRHRSAVLDGWRERALAAYPAETSRFLRAPADPFSNPVGTALRDDLALVLDAFARGGELGDAAEALERIVRVRAVQGLGVRGALGFVLDLRRVVREVAGAECPPEARAALDLAVDGLMIDAVAIYVACREQIQDIRVQEMRNRSVSVLERLERWRSNRDAHSGPDDGPEGT